ncbi:MAG: bifunctional DNA-formamidopyrimidine glycosylase/DNA-(apurinic or apyrimidinic site) lyase [Desulfobacterales bacterium]|nr:bifunctional DNA-formamidopyrimidine glycosylase/DNA-(apurinic or apyrimidinic site) lyase [Desulfobacterales bacterium]
MPELPEVEVTRLGLAPLLPGRRVMRIYSSDKELRLPLPGKLLRQWIMHAVVRRVDRRAKYLLIRMDNGAVLVVHLGMSGRLALMPANAPRAKHDHFRLGLDNGRELRFNDSRRFGAIQVLPPGRKHEKDFFKNHGPEPLGRSFTAGYMLERASIRKQPVKLFLMDGRVVAGIGNIYANEILFAAGIRPDTPAGKLNEKQWQAVVRHCRRILRLAIRSGGTTISDFLNASGESGYFQLDLRIYGRAGQPCRICATPVIRTVLGGRATYYCPTCQKS